MCLSMFSLLFCSQHKNNLPWTTAAIPMVPLPPPPVVQSAISCFSTSIILMKNKDSMKYFVLISIATTMIEFFVAPTVIIAPVTENDACASISHLNIHLLIQRILATRFCFPFKQNPINLSIQP